MQLISMIWWKKMMDGVVKVATVVLLLNLMGQAESQKNGDSKSWDHFYDDYSTDFN